MREEAIGHRSRSPSPGGVVRAAARGAAVAWILLGLGACGLLAEDEGLEPVSADELAAIRFSSPDIVTVQKGDSLSRIGQRFGVSAADLIAWNGLTSQTIEIGQPLLVWTLPPEVDAPVVVAAQPKPRSSGGIRSSLQRMMGTQPAPAPAPVVVAATPEVPAPAPGRQVVKVDRGAVRGAGILGVNLSGSDVDLEGAAAGMSRHDSDLGSNSLGNRGGGLSTGGTADTIEVAQRELKVAGQPQIPNTPVTAPKLTRPAPKRCLSGPSGTIDENGVATSQGLSVAQINAGVGAISRSTVKCFPRGTVGSYTVIAELLVGCDGQVDNVYLINAGVVPSHVTKCIEQTLSYAGFAAHAVPDGVSFQVPLKFSF